MSVASRANFSLDINYVLTVVRSGKVKAVLIYGLNCITLWTKSNFKKLYTSDIYNLKYLIFPSDMKSLLFKYNTTQLSLADMQIFNVFDRIPVLTKAKWTAE